MAMLIRRNSLGSVALSDPSARRLKVTIGRDGVVRHGPAAWHLCQYPAGRLVIRAAVFTAGFLVQTLFVPD
jgi:hypothetical protein